MSVCKPQYFFNYCNIFSIVILLFCLERKSVVLAGVDVVLLFEDPLWTEKWNGRWQQIYHNICPLLSQKSQHTRTLVEKKCLIVSTSSSFHICTTCIDFGLHEISEQWTPCLLICIPWLKQLDAGSLSPPILRPVKSFYMKLFSRCFRKLHKHVCSFTRLVSQVKWEGLKCY